MIEVLFILAVAIGVGFGAFIMQHSGNQKNKWNQLAEEELARLRKEANK